MRVQHRRGKVREVERQRQVVGRQAELEQLTASLEPMRSGFQACVITGPAGMGKTTLWRRALELARSAGFTVLRTRPGETEARLSYAGLSDLLDGVEPERFEELPAVQRRALEVAVLQRDAGDTGVDARAVATGLLSVLRDVAEVAPVLVAVDDAQWLDASTASALAYALRRLEDRATGVLASIRVDDRHPPTFVDVLPVDRLVRLGLRPLSVASIHAVVRSELGWVPPRPTLAKIVAASEGNPFHALEIARELHRLGTTSVAGSLPIPEQSRALVRARLARLPRETRDALLAAACLSAPTTALVNEEALAAAEETGVVRIDHEGCIRFAHPLLASGVYELAPAARRRAMHSKLADRAVDVEERARHLALGAAAPDPNVAATVEEAARRAHGRGAPDAAAELMELALSLTPATAEAERARRLVFASGVLFDTGDLARAQALLEQALDETSDHQLRALALRLLGRLYARRSSFAEAVELMLAAREAAGGDDRTLAAEIELDLAFFRFNVGDFAGGDGHARAAVELAEAADDDGLLASALGVRTVTAFLCGRGLAESDLRRAMAIADPLRETPIALRPRFVHGFLMLCTGQLDDSLATLETLRAMTLERGRESDVPLLFLYLVWAAAWRGDMRRAVGVAEDALQTASLLDDRLADALALSASALARAHAGDAERARLDSTKALRHFEQLEWWGGAIWPCWARAFVELSVGRPDAAHEAVRPLTEMLATVGPGDPALAMFLPDDVEALLELGRADEAEALLDPFEQRARELERSWAVAAASRCRGLLDASRGDLEGALHALKEAISHHDRSPMPFERARTLLALGQVRRRRKERRLARLALEEALTAFETLGTPLWAEKAKAELARVATRKAQPGLTATEERIARLAAEGLSNRMIAERAFVSVKTVEANLKRAYRKLGISSRAQLARALDRPSAPTIS